MAKRLIPVDKVADVLPQYQNTPVSSLLEYHNLNRPFESYSQAEILIGMCMDYRQNLRIPHYFAYIMRTGGADLRFSEFKISYVIGVGGVKAITVLGHNYCGMVDIAAKKELFIKGLVENAGWEREMAEQHFAESLKFDIGDEIDFVLNEAERLDELYPKILVAPLFFNVDNNRIYQIIDDRG